MNKSTQLYNKLLKWSSIKDVRTEGRRGSGTMQTKVDKGEGSIFTVFLRTSFTDDP